MVLGVNNINSNIFQPEVSTSQRSEIEKFESLNSFYKEDQAIISSEAKLLNELEKFNSGEDNLVDLVLASVLAEITVSAEVNVIESKMDMMDTILEIGKKD